MNYEGTKNKAKRRKSGWPADPAARSLEMQRRRALWHGDAKKSGPKKPKVTLAKATHPRDPNHPDHAKWVAKMRRSNKKFWAGMTPEERAARIAKFTAGRKKAKKRPTVREALVKMAVAS